MSVRAAHRGPDDQGLLLFNRDGSHTEIVRNKAVCEGDWVAGLAHRRLSIIDLSSAGHQPMSDPTGRYWIVYNGEVYNYIELRNELIAAGIRFSSNTDCEVVLRAVIEWGPVCLARFNGMWAFAIYDSKEGGLFCARDRYGVKPFCYAIEGGRFAFASEVKQLLALPWVRADASREQIADFFLWGLENHTDETFFAGIRKLPGSHYIKLTRDDIKRGRIEPKCYWKPVPVNQLSERDAVVAFRDLLSDAVRLRLRSDVPVGFTLSGGLDSSSVICVAINRGWGGTESALKAFNVEYEGLGYSERRFAEAAAVKAGADMTILRPQNEALAKDWQRFIYHMEQPVGGLSYFSNYQIYGLIRQHGVPVVLSGQGGDELLLGYERYRVYTGLFGLKAIRPYSVLSEAHAARRRANLPTKTQLGHALYFSWPALRAARRRRLVRPILRPEFFSTYSGEEYHLRASMRYANRLALQRGELFAYTLPYLLHHEDRVSMAQSVETRLPFLDYRLLELVLGQPVEFLFRDGWSKYILRQAMDGILPPEVRNRTDKMGYETPTGVMIRANRGVFLPLLARNRDDSILDVPAIERRFESEKFDERLLCGAVSYLAWKESFSLV